MKKLIILLLSFLLHILAQAQSYTTVDFFSSSHINRSGYYYKDTFLYYNQFIGGTWQYTAPNLIIQLRFNVKTFTDVDYKKDILIGGIRIVKNGVEVVNTLADVNVTKPLYLDYLLSSVDRLKNTTDCYNCAYQNQMLRIHYKEPNNDNVAFQSLYFDMNVYQNAQNQPMLRVVFNENVLVRDPNWYDPLYEDAPTKTSLFLPFGNLDFVKLP